MLIPRNRFYSLSDFRRDKRLAHSLHKKMLALTKIGNDYSSLIKKLFSV